jgi:thiamine biosynthesis lipoprotein ApbE
VTTSAPLSFDRRSTTVALHLSAGQAIATSGFGRRQWTNGDGTLAHHLIDPRTGAPGPRVHATVIAGDPVTADVTATMRALRPERLDQCRVPALLQRDGETAFGAHWRFTEQDDEPGSPVRAR